MKPSEYIKKGWCQGTLARNKNLKPVLPKSSEAKRWCASGAIYASSGLDKYDYAKVMRQVILVHYPRFKGCTSVIIAFNDYKYTYSHAVLKIMLEVEKILGLD